MLPKYPLIDRKDAIAHFVDFLQEEGLKVFLIKGEAMMGKSRVLQEYRKISENRRLKSVFIDLKSKNEEFLLLYEIARQVNLNLFPAFSAIYSNFLNQRVNITRVTQLFSKMSIQENYEEKLNKYRLLEFRSAFLSDLDALPQDMECVIIIDSFDAATETVKKWLAEEFIVPVSKKRRVKIVVAGTIVPIPSATWEDQSEFYELCSVTKDDCINFCKELGIVQDEKVIGEFLLFFQGRPGAFIQYATWYLSSRREIVR
ncbi:MAG: hypothetical protein EHM20_17335 [Alphaproteobacteria bacterium]|nr:MAG: hypothetical protein EHM20_17335 [Alphaproteobacteria bacterium]